MKKIYLLSGPGTIEGFSKDLLSEMKKDLKDTKSISFIASSPMKHEKNLNYIYGSKGITGMINHLKEIHTFEQVNVIDELNKDKNLLINSDVIYLLGGNYETQLEFINDNGFDKILRDFNGILLCTSCGAMNIAKKGYYSKDEDVSESFFYNGIGLIDVTIDPHFDINNKEQVEEALKMSSEHKIYGVPNDSGLIIVDNEIKKIGNIYVFNNRTLISEERFDDTMKNGTKKIETERLILRKFNENDYKMMFDNWASDEVVAKNAGWPKHEKKEETKELVKIWIDEYKEENTFNWIIELKDKFPIGSITVIKKDLNNRTCEIGYNIGSKFWNNGYATEAIKAVIDYLFSLDLFDTITGQCFEYNIPSSRVLEKNGFKKEGILRNKYILDGKKLI